MWWIMLKDYSGNQLIEVDGAKEREFTHLLNRTNSFSFKVPIDNDAAPYLNTKKIIGEAWYGGEKRIVGQMMGFERVAERGERSIKVTFADPSWSFQFRRVGKSATGYVQTALTDRGQIAKALIDAANAETATGVITGGLSYLSGSTTTYSSGPFKRLSEAIADLSMPATGFDWEIVPRSLPVFGSLGDWHAEPLIGGLMEDVLFEYIAVGGGGNIATAHEITDWATMANFAYHIADTGPDSPGAPTVNASNSTSIAEWGRFEDVVEASLVDQGLRQSLVNEHVAIRANPRSVISFQPRSFPMVEPGDVPVFGTDYGLGDVVRASATDESGTWFDGLARVYGYTSRPGDTGMENGDLLLVED